ncbi:MAG: hypothetical protein AAGE18_03570 [Pseudomonadota bacterium]
MSRGKIRALVLCAMLLAAPAFVGGAHGMERGARADASGQEALYAQTCSHYDNRARFLTREGALAFVVVLADSCAQALSRFADPTVLDPDPGQEAARSYLDRLTRFKALILGMNRDRMLGPDPGRRSGARFAGGAPVSETGAYLIARRLGLLHAYSQWVASGGEDLLAQR